MKVSNIVLASMLISNLLVTVGAQELRVFNPFAVISGETYNSINIWVDKELYVAEYSPQIQSFSPITIPFYVETTDGIATDYRLTLPTSTHKCNDDDELVVSVTLDGNEWPDSGLSFNGFSDQYDMEVTFSEVIQDASVNQDCFGTFVIQVEKML